MKFKLKKIDYGYELSITSPSSYAIKVLTKEELRELHNIVTNQLQKETINKCKKEED